MNDTAATPTPFEIFRPGTHTAMNGQSYTITAEDLEKTAAAYNPAAHEAPFVKGHPGNDDPAFGWVGAVEFKDGALRVTDRRQVEPAFAEAVRSGRFKKRSARFWPPEHPSNPTPGIWALRHVGFLGAMPPAVKGMADIAEFAEDSDGLLVATTDCDGAEFAEPEATEASRLARVLKSVLGEVFGGGSAFADATVPDFLIRDADPASAASDTETSMTDTDKDAAAKKAAADAAFAERENEIKTREEKLAAREKAAADAEAKARRSEDAAFVEQLGKDGKLLPREQGFITEFLSTIGGETVEFAEGDQTVKANPRERFKQFLEGLPERVDFSEAAGVDADDDAGAAAFAAPGGYQVDRKAAELHSKAKAYAAKHNVSFQEAARAVGA